jgi:hypothetical protein
MEEEYKRYILRYCRRFMLPEEEKVMKRLSFTDKQWELYNRSRDKTNSIDMFYGSEDEATNALLKLGEERATDHIAERIYKTHYGEIFNLCPKCGKLLRTPWAQQCRNCGHDWH